MKPKLETSFEIDVDEVRSCLGTRTAYVGEIGEPPMVESGLKVFLDHDVILSGRRAAVSKVDGGFPIHGRMPVE